MKLATVGFISMAVAGLSSLVVTWWASPLDTVNANRFSPPMFDQRGIVVIGYAAFAFALGVTAGVVIRRTVPAMATTLFVFVFVRLAVIHWLRPNFFAPEHRSTSLDAVGIGYGRTNSGPDTLMADHPHLPNAWVSSTRIVDKAGHTITAGFVDRTCPRLGVDLGPPPVAGGRAVRSQVPEGVENALRECVAKVATKYHAVTTYQPAGRYWSFQWYELTIFLAAAITLSGFCFWWVRRRLS